VVTFIILNDNFEKGQGIHRFSRMAIFLLKKRVFLLKNKTLTKRKKEPSQKRKKIR